MIKTRRFALFAMWLIVFISAVKAQKNIDYVDPFIGTTNFSVTNPGAVCPNGLMSVVPFNVMGSDLNKYDKDARWWSAPYEYSNKYFTGFAHVTLSGVGCPEMGTLLVMPTMGELQVDYHSYGSEYSAEKAAPGYYSNRLSKYDILCEVTSTLRTSAERYTFHRGKGHILLNLGEGLTNETGSMVRRVSNTEIEGFRLLGTFCYTSQAVFPMYFVMRVSKAPIECGFWKKQPKKKGVEAEWDPDDGTYKLYKHYGREIAGDDTGYYFSYNCDEGEQIEVQIGVSFVSIENARRNLNTEQPNFNFNRTLSAAQSSWENCLSRVSVEGGTEAQKRIFYTALYHTQIHPNILQDVNGEYPKMESADKACTTGNRYTVFSLWDTYRNLSQLMTLIYPEKQTEMIRSMIDMYKEWGWMPKWELFGRETFTMEGDPAIPTIVDTWMKGLHDFDIQTAYKAFFKSATTQGKENKLRPDIDSYLSKGYIPLGAYKGDLSGDNSVSHALEYYVADNALSVLANALGKKADATRFKKQALGYRHYFSKESGTLRPLYADGKFYKPFDPKAGANFSNTPGFHEGSAWNYTFYVPFDIQGLARLMGGKQAFIDKLQKVFDENLYDPANEPDIAYPYLFSYFKGEEWRTQVEVQRLLAKYYTDKPDGIPGNDDTGTMSAWVVFSMMGLYPDCPGSPYYTLTTPTFNKITIQLDKKYYPNGKLEIIANRKSLNDRYIGNIQLDSNRQSSYRISHADLIRAHQLTFNLIDKH